MPIRDLLKKKDRVEKSDSIHHEAAAPEAPAPVPEFTFMRSDTYTQEIITPPTFHHSDAPSPTDGANESKFRHTLFKGRQRSTSSASTSSRTSSKSKERPPPSPTTRRLSHRLGLKRDDSSSNVPQDLPEITAGENEGKESQWEKRATILAHTNEKNRSTPGTPIGSPASLSHNMSSLSLGNTGGEAATHELGVVSTKLVDDNIQEAIRLHEAGELETSTQMFGRLADPNGENNALSQVLYGLALRHGWGCTPDPEKAVTFLSAAASNAAGIEELALQAGMKKGGAAKGELVLAIFELANCFRHGWGVQIDKVAAKQYYETAANLGDTDAMNEVAWCYVEGFGCKKDKYLGAKYYRLAEAGGSKTLGNTWIWKEKYNPPTTAMK